MKVIPLDYVLILVFTVLCKTCKQQLIWAGNVVMLTQSNSALKPSVKGKGKGKGHFYLTSVVPSVQTRLLSMEADGQLSKSFTVVIQPLLTRLIKPNFCFDLSHRRSTAV